MAHITLPPDCVPQFTENNRLREEVRFGYVESIESELEANKACKRPQQPSEYSSLLGEAIRYRQHEIHELLLLEGVPITPDALSAAAEKRSLKALSMLVSHGCDINMPLAGHGGSLVLRSSARSPTYRLS